MTSAINRRTLLGLAAAALAAPALSACSSSSPSPAKVSEAKADIARASITTPGDVPAAIGVLAAKLLAQGSLTNAVISPLSILTALEMLRNGAEGTTATQMDAVLGVGLNDGNQGLNTLAQVLAQRAGERHNTELKGTVTLQQANSVWSQAGLSIETPMLDALARFYGSGMHLVDYMVAAAAARTAINGWVSDQTKGHIPDLIPANALDSSTRMVLVNAIYFKAPWTKVFGVVGPRTFHATGGDTQRTFIQGSAVAWQATPTWQAARIPYLGEELAMTVVLPTHSLSDVVAAWRAGGMAPMLSRPTASNVSVSMPTWETKATLTLAKALVALGMRDAFDPNHADFSGITRQESLVLSQVFHQAWVKVDEHGSEAAAATGDVMVGSSGVAADHALVLDRPFAWVIHDVATATPLFVGTVG